MKSDTVIDTREVNKASPNSGTLETIHLQLLAATGGRRLSLRAAVKCMLIDMDKQHFFQEVILSATPNGVECCLVKNLAF